MKNIPCYDSNSCEFVQDSSKFICASSIRNKVCINTSYGDACFYSFNNLSDKKEHLALVFNKADQCGVPIVRIHSECMTGDVFGSAKCDCGDQLDEAMQTFSEHGGIILYLRQEGRGIGLYNKLDAYSLQNKGFDTFEANQLLHFPDDLREYSVAAEMLHALNIKKIRLLTNNKEKVNDLKKYGIEVEERISTSVFVKEQNKGYLAAKKSKSLHQFSNKKNISNYFSKRGAL